MGIFDRHRGGTIRVHILIKGRIGEAWRDIDEHLRLPVGTTLAQLVDRAGAEGIPLRESLAVEHHGVGEMRAVGERCPFEDNRERRLSDGDEIYLLAPLAGG